MCGIAGSYALNNESSLRGSVEKATAALQKRGPDSGAVFEGGSSVLGHRRLSIIDTSCNGDQPMSTSDGRYTIVFNGEIFNYLELRDMLSEEQRASLRSGSDTEVFLLLFASLGTEVFIKLRGFFAAAIWDRDTDTLTLVRDRFGKKPLLIYEDEKMLCFASEMKALFQMGIPKEIRPEILSIYLQLNYIPQPHSIIKNVRKLQPGTFIQVMKGSIKEQTYYTLKAEPDLYNKYSYEGAKEKLVELMDESVRLRLISDVPIGAFLSGGIDSSVVVALASRHTSKLSTFSIGYKDNPYFDETSYAKLVASKYKTDHTVFSLGNDDFLEHVQSVLDYIDEPFADSSAIPVYILSYHTRKHVTVALSGDGGDEVFAGYNKHGAEWKMRQGGMINSVMKGAHPILSMLPKSRNNKITNTFRQLHRYSTGASLKAADRYWQWASFNSAPEALSLLHSSVRNKVDNSIEETIREKYKGDIEGKDFNEVLLADMNLVLLSDMLVKVDLMSMANSLEIRSPFLDAEVVDFAFSLPSSYKIDGTLKKKIVQDAFRSMLPEELYNRPKKGFEIPLLDWFRNELWTMIDEDLLKDSFVEEQGLFDVEAIKALKKKLKSSNPGDSHATIWALVVFQHWWKRYMV